MDHPYLCRNDSKAKEPGNHKSVDPAMAEYGPAISCDVDEDAIPFAECETVRLTSRSEPTFALGRKEDLVKLLVTPDNIFECSTTVGALRAVTLDALKLEHIGARLFPTQTVPPVAQAGGGNRIAVKWIGLLVPITTDDVTGVGRLEPAVAIATATSVKPDPLAPQRRTAAVAQQVPSVASESSSPELGSPLLFRHEWIIAKATAPVPLPLTNVSGLLNPVHTSGGERADAGHQTDVNARRIVPNHRPRHERRAMAQITGAVGLSPPSSQDQQSWIRGPEVHRATAGRPAVRQYG